jgi:Tol biopolymer transport system component
MRRTFHPLFAATAIAILLMVPACSTFTEPPKQNEPTFAPGEYGGDPLPGTEYLSNVKASPSGDRYALIRKRTPGEPSDPRNQLWIVDRDGSTPRLVSVNTGTVDWGPDGESLAVTVVRGIDVYAYTIDLKTGETTQWNGKEYQRLSLPVVNNPIWFGDGRRLLASVAQEAYQQSFPRGVYIIDTQDSTTAGPLLEYMQAASLGNSDSYVIARKYTEDNEPPSGNFIRYDFADRTWHWITDFPTDSLRRHVDPPVPSPINRTLVQSRTVQNAPQLFAMNHRGKNVRQITERGGDNPRWGGDGSSFIFRRDVHRGEGARYVPFRFDLESMQAEPLWPALPDSVPDFPDLSTQSLDKITPRR